MGVIVADEQIEQDRVQQSAQVLQRITGDLAQQRKAVLQAGPAFCLVLELRWNAQRLAKVLLV